MEVIKAPNESIERVIETFETFIALKKVIQCSAIIIPENNNFNIKDFETVILFLKIKAYNNNTIEANVILYQTSSIESIEINDPNIAVNPKIKTIK
jgi:hypothetical protein